jgi:peptidoglycan-associated lipoprotein
MKKLTYSAVLVVLVAGGLSTACSKNKKPATAADTSAATTPGATTDTSGAPTDTASTDTTATAAANLGPVIYFEFDQSTLSEEARKELEANAKWLTEDPSRTLTIEGHTDEVGTTEYNVALGERRARTAFDYLVRLGIDEKRIQILSLGEERPASTDDSQNRRAMFIATKKK